MRFVALSATTALFTGFLGPAQAEEGGISFVEAFSGICGKKFVGEVVESIESDQLWRDSRIVMHVRDCNEGEVRIPLSVGEDHSRTWVISGEGDNLTLKHDHRHEDGTPDAVTNYGGTVGIPIMTVSGEYYVRHFPADDYSKELFVREGLDASVENTWVLTLAPGNMFSYRLQRPGRTFQVDFDLAQPVE